MTENEARNMSDAEWKGYISRAIEDIDSKLTDLCNGRDENRKEIVAMKGKSGRISGIVSVITSVVMGLLGWFILHLQSK